MIQAIELPHVPHYFWVSDGDNVRDKIREVQESLGDQISLLISWETYKSLYHEYSEQLKWHDPPDYDCLDMFLFESNLGTIIFMVTR